MKDISAGKGRVGSESNRRWNHRSDATAEFDEKLLVKLEAQLLQCVAAADEIFAPLPRCVQFGT